MRGRLTEFCLLGRESRRGSRQTEGVIRDLDVTLAGWLGALLPGVSISFEPPGPGGAHTKRAAPVGCLAVVLLGVREEADGSLSGWAELRADDGLVMGRVPPSRRYRFTYLLVAQAADALTEHEVLGRVLSGAALHEVVPVEHLRGSLEGAEHAVIVRCAPATGSIDSQQVWGVLGTTPRASLELSVLAPLPLAALLDVAAAPRHIELGAGWVPSDGSGTDQQEPPLRPTRRIQEP